MLIPQGACPSTVRTQVAIVGAGPAGIALALRLADAGIQAALLESGVERPNSDADALSVAAEQPALHAQLGGFGARRLGGASWLWGGRCVAYDEVDFTARPHAEAPSWPIDRAEIMRQSQAASEFFGIGAPEFEISAPSGLAGSDVEAVLERWCAQPRLALIHRKKLQTSQAVRAFLGLTCVGAAFDGPKLERLHARTLAGDSVEVEADAFVLAAGGVETARLLLWMLQGRGAPLWLGRGYMGHLYGKIADVTFSGAFEDEFDYWREAACFVRRRILFSANKQRAEDLLNIAFHIDNPPLGDWRHGMGGLSLLALGLSAPVLGAALAPGPMRKVLLGVEPEAGDWRRHAANVLQSPFSAAAVVDKALFGRLSIPARPGVIERNQRHRYAVKFSAEQLARFDSKIELSAEKDALGVPKAIIAPKIDDYDVESVLRAHDLLDAALQRAGIGALHYHAAVEERAELVRHYSGDGYHQIGTARMGDDPATSVVGANACVHGVRNLFVAGSAVFPTSSQANPTFTIVCQALRLADHLARTFSADRMPPVMLSKETT